MNKEKIASEITFKYGGGGRVFCCLEAKWVESIPLQFILINLYLWKDQKNYVWKICLFCSKQYLPKLPAILNIRQIE